ncbi:MAG: ribose 5-phosphate isomerase B [Deltaproteobacteria bacterium]|jgi:ribose 5-phosphate isomerase B|nr:ribose 5-phosphate isomerase B [Deltaproteobacteria bacterium]
MDQTTVAVGSDHAGPEFKDQLIAYLRQKGFAALDFGIPAGTERANYPDVARKVAEAVARGEAQFGILICGTGLGMAMVANKTPGVRAAPCVNEFMAEMARAHNDANVLALGVRVIGPGLAHAIVDRFLSVSFAGGRHAERLALFS